MMIIQSLNVTQTNKREKKKKRLKERDVFCVFVSVGEREERE